MRAVLSIFVLLVAICSHFVSVDAVSCKYGEEYKCSHKLCDRTCDNIETELVCDQICTNGCYCAEGFVRVSHDRCKPEFYCEYASIVL